VRRLQNLPEQVEELFHLIDVSLFENLRAQWRKTPGPAVIDIVAIADRSSIDGEEGCLEIIRLVARATSEIGLPLNQSPAMRVLS
jgi:hypothetical protein